MMLQGVAMRRPQLASLPTALEALPVRGWAAAVPCAVKCLSAHPGFPNPPELPTWLTAVEGQMDCIAPAYTHTRPVRGPLPEAPRAPGSWVAGPRFRHELRGRRFPRACPAA